MTDDEEEKYYEDHPLLFKYLHSPNCPQSYEELKLKLDLAGEKTKFFDVLAFLLTNVNRSFERYENINNLYKDVLKRKGDIEEMFKDPSYQKFILKSILHKINTQLFTIDTKMVEFFARWKLKEFEDTGELDIL